MDEETSNPITITKFDTVKFHHIYNLLVKTPITVFKKCSLPHYFCSVLVSFSLSFSVQ